MGARHPETFDERFAGSRAHQVLDAALDARGFAAGDFELEEQSSAELSQLLGVVGGILTVRCRSTGEERFYSTGAGSTWFGAFLMDLARGHFAGAARQNAPVTALPLSQLLASRPLYG
jgi:hypothetical protein